MIILYILLGVFLLFCWLLLVRIKVCIVAENTVVWVQLRYLFLHFTLYDSRQSDVRIKRKEAKKTRKKQAERLQKEKESPKRSLKEKLSLVRNLLSSLPTPLRMVARHLHLTDICFVYTVSREDAAQTAIGYGQVCAAIGGAVAFAQSVFQHLQFKQYQILANYEKKEDSFSLSLTVWLRPMILLGAAIRFGGEFFQSVKQTSSRVTSETKGGQQYGGKQHQRSDGNNAGKTQTTH